MLSRRNTPVSLESPAQRPAVPRALGLVVCLLASLLLAGCRPHDEASTAGKPRIALVMKSLANEFFLTMENGARAHQKAHPDQYDLIANGIKDELDVGKQMELVEQMIAQKVSAIVIAPADSKALVPVCKKAQEAGIRVVNIDNKFDDAVLSQSGVKIPFVGPDNRKGAKAVGDYLATKLQAGDKVAIIEGAPNAFNGAQRKRGFEDAMQAAGAQDHQFTVRLLGDRQGQPGRRCRDHGEPGPQGVPVRERQHGTWGGGGAPRGQQARSGARRRL